MELVGLEAGRAGGGGRQRRATPGAAVDAPGPSPPAAGARWSGDAAEAGRRWSGAA